MVTITMVYKKSGYYGKSRKLKIFADDEFLGDMKPGDETQFVIPENSAYLFGKMDWGKTEKFVLENISDGECLEIISYFSFNPLRGLGIKSIPIEIRRA